MKIHQNSGSLIESKDGMMNNLTLSDLISLKVHANDLNFFRQKPIQKIIDL